MNSNPLMLSKAIVTQEALREEARESRRRRAGNDRSRTASGERHLLGLLRRR
ncbi:MAG TPA: hypothetical protein VMH33_12540 [Solirubrobacterales bacterium]|nr:hypothetical protein [Solirubrobacterales bacterium]